MTNKYFQELWMMMCIFLFTFLLCGCAFTGSMFNKDISKCSEFDSYVGRNFILNRDVGFVKESLYSYYGIYELDDVIFNRLKNNTLHKDELTIGYIKAGARLRIDKIILEKIYAGPTLIRAKGVIYLNSLKDNVEFKYNWGGKDIIVDAPWDDDYVDKIRFIDVSKCVD